MQIAEQDHVRVDCRQQAAGHHEVAGIAALVEGRGVDQFQLHVDADLAEIIDLELLLLGDALGGGSEHLEREAIGVAGFGQKGPGLVGVIFISGRCIGIDVHPGQQQ